MYSETISRVIHVGSESMAFVLMMIACIVLRSNRVSYLALFLGVGLITDLINTFCDETVRLGTIRLDTLSLMVYCFFEAYFFLFYLTLPLNLTKKFKITASIVIAAWWIYTSFFILYKPAINHGYHPYFDMLYEGGGAVLAALSLLKLTQRDKEEVDQFYFWSLIILFYYSFCIFYIHTFNGLKAVQSVWYISRYIDALALLSYCVLAVFTVIRKRQQSQNEFA
jgi:hypothetical protein